MTAVISACIYKNLSEFGEFLYNHFNIEDGKIKATFWHTVHIISRKVKKIMQCMEKVLWLIECVKSGLWLVSLDMFQGRVDLEVQGQLSQFLQSFKTVFKNGDRIDI